MPGSQTALGRAGARNSAPVRIAFRKRNSVGTQDDVDFAAQWLAYAIPCRRFACILADTCARLGADVVCYSFIIVDFHHLLLADLSAHSASDPLQLIDYRVQRRGGATELILLLYPPAKMLRGDRGAVAA